MFEETPNASLRHRSPAAYAASALVHAVAALALFNIAFPETARQAGLRIVPVYVPEPVVGRAPARSPASRPVPSPPVPVEKHETVSTTTPSIAAPSPPEPASATIPEAIHRPAVVPPPVSAPEFRPPDPLRTGTFASSAAIMTNTGHPQSLPQIGTFDSAVEPGRPRVAVETRVQSAKFEQPKAAIQAPPDRAPVASGSLGAVIPGMRSGAEAVSAPVLSGSFGAPEAAPPRAVSRAAVARAEFGSVEARAPLLPKAPPVSGHSAELEILDKPRPLYSEEARKLKVEGVVVLEVSFSAGGTARVLRVVRGLGHGLDENAMNAAAGIRFRPAVERGRPVDTVALVRIEFQLAY